MEAVFTYAAVYQAEAVCRTPLRTGGTDGDPEQVLRSRNGQAFVHVRADAVKSHFWRPGRSGTSARLRRRL